MISPTNMGGISCAGGAEGGTVANFFFASFFFLAKKKVDKIRVDTPDDFIYNKSV